MRIDGPDTGSTRTDRLRDDAESDPMNEQTEETDVGSPGPQERERARREREQLSDDDDGSSSSGDGSDSGSDTVGSPGPQERQEAEQEADRQLDDSSSSGSGSRSGGSDSNSDNGGLDDSSQAPAPESGSGQNGSDLDRGDPDTGLTESEQEQMDAEVIGDTASDPSEEQIENLRRVARERADGRDVQISRTPSGAAVAYAGEDAEQAATTSTRRATAQQFEEQAENELGEDLTPGQDYTVTQTDSGFQAELTQSYRRRRAEQEIERQLEEQTGEDLTPGQDFTVEQTDDGYEAELSDEYLNSQVEEQLEEELGRNLTPGQDFTVEERTFGGHSPSAAQRTRARQIREAEGVEEAGEYLETATSAQTVRMASLTDEFQRELQAESASVNPDARTREQLGVGEMSGTGTSESESELPGRRDEDIFSGLVEGTENALSEVAQVASGDESTRVEFQGEGSVVNTARREAVSGQVDLVTDLGPISDAGNWASDSYDHIVREYTQPVGEVAGDVADLSQSGARVSTAGRPENLLAQQFGIDTGGDLNTVEQEVETAPERVRDISRGEEQEQTDSRLFEETAGSATSAALSVPALPLGVAGTATDAVEFSVRGAQRVGQGEGGEFAAEAGGQAALVSAEVSESAVNNPGSTVGAVAGTAVASGGLIGGARALGGARAGRAVSTAIQPGEEAALTAARRGVPAARRVSNTVGDVSTRGRGSGLSLSDPVTQSRQRLSQATPDVSVSVVRAPNAPALDIASGVSRSDIDIGSGVRSRARGSVERVRQAPDRVRERAATAQQQAQLDIAAGRQAVTDVGESVRTAPSRARSAVSERVEGGRESLSNLAEQRAQQAQLDLAAGEQRLRQGADRLRQTPRRAEQSARRTAREIEEFTGQVRGEFARRSSTGLLGDESTGRVNIPSGSPDLPSFDGDVLSGARSRAEAARFDVTQRVAAAESRASEIADRVSRAPSEARLEARRLARDAPSLAGDVRAEMSRRTSTSLLADESTGRARPPSLPDVSNPFEGASDLTLRVDIGRPERNTVDAGDLEIDTTGTATVDDFGSIEQSTTDPFESSFEADSSPQRAVTIERGRERATGRRTGTGAEFDGMGTIARGMRTTETSIDSSQVTDPALGFGQVQPTPQDAGTDVFQPGQSDLDVGGLESTAGADDLVDSRSGPMFDSSFDSDVRPGSELSFEQEQRQEVRAEPSLGGNPRREPMMGGNRRRGGGGDAFDGQRPGWARRVDRELLNPFTGR